MKPQSGFEVSEVALVRGCVLARSSSQCWEVKSAYMARHRVPASAVLSHAGRDTPDGLSQSNILKSLVSITRTPGFARLGWSRRQHGPPVIGCSLTVKRGHPLSTLKTRVERRKRLTLADWLSGFQGNWKRE